MILLKANGQDLTVEQMERVASDFINVCTVHWSFDSRWDGMVKTAQYTQIDKETKERTTYSVLIDDATGCAILPNEIKAGELLISAFGVDAGSNQRITTIPVKVKVYRSGFVGDGETPIPPSPDLYDQLLNRVAAIQGTVESVNGYQGVILLTAEDVNARPDTWTPTAEEVGAVSADQGEDNAGKALVVGNDGRVIPGEVAGGGGAVESVNGQTGAVTLDAEDVGARPATWTPTAEDVGAAKADHTHTAAEVGARPATWTPTAEDVGAAEADHTHDMNSIDGLADAILASGQAVKIWPPEGTTGTISVGGTAEVPEMAYYNIIIIQTNVGKCVAWPTGSVLEDGAQVVGGGFTIDAGNGGITQIAARFTYNANACTLVKCNSLAGGTTTARTVSTIYGMCRKE